MTKDIKMLQGFIAFMAVNSVYGSGKQCNKEGKENLALEKYLVLVKSFTEGSGIFKVIEEYQKADFSEDKLRFQKKTEVMTAEQCWKRGMGVRSDLTKWIPKYAGLIKFKTLNKVDYCFFL